MDLDIRRSGQSTEDSVTALFEQLRPSLVSYAYHLTGSARDAEDMVQIAFLEIFDQLSRRADIRNLDVVHQAGEPHLIIVPGCLPYPPQRTLHDGPVLCPVRV
ncbi:MAG: sigma factor, partial [Pyrinomonadaceae bacterium]